MLKTISFSSFNFQTNHLSTSSGVFATASKISSVWHGILMPVKKTMLTGPIIIVEDDKDDCDMYTHAIQAMNRKNRVQFFHDGVAAHEYLSTTEEQPFIIISDINMPRMNGLQLKKEIQNDAFLVTKGIPFVFISTDASIISLRHAYALSVQGFFQKPTSLEELEKMLRNIFAYWEQCRHVNNS